MSALVLWALAGLSAAGSSRAWDAGQPWPSVALAALAVAAAALAAWAPGDPLGVLRYFLREFYGIQKEGPDDGDTRRGRRGG